MSFAEIRRENGYPALYVDGKRTVPLAYHLALCGAEHVCAQKCIPQFHEAGINVVGIIYSLASDWKAGGYDGTTLLREVTAVKRANPQAKILLRIKLAPPYFWMRKNRDELVKYYGVTCGDLEEQALHGVNTDTLNDMRASFASKKWQAEVCEIFKTMHHILVEHGFGDDIFAIQPAYGTCGEWHIYGKYYGQEKDLFEGDYSNPMLAYFREYLQEKYRTDVELQKAWGDDTVTLETARLATPTQRKSYCDVNGFLYRLPEYHMQALDSLKCLQTAATFAITCFAKALKTIWENKILVGAFYGYYFACGDVFGRMLEPHLLFGDKNIDYLAGPNAYTANKKSGNAAFLRYCAESMRLNGKLFFSEVDQGYKAKCIYRNEQNGSKYLCENDDEYNALTARNVFESVLRGMGAWYFDHQHPEDYGRLAQKTGYWDTPARMKQIQRIREATEEMLALRPTYRSTNDVLIVYDTQSIYHFGPSKTCDSTDVHHTYNQFDMSDAISKSGVAYDMIWLYDLLKCDISKYKCVLFVNCAAMRKKEYEYIKKTVMDGGRTVAFMRKNGFIVEDKTSLENMTELYGCMLKDGYFESQRDNFRLVTISEFQYKPSFYRELFKTAGAHIYTENEEVLCVANDFVMVHAKDVPITTLHLKCGDITFENEKYTTKVYDNLTGRRLL